MKKVVVIIDYAHGSNVPGKCSPDKKHKEWVWSRARGREIKFMLKVLGFEVYESNPLDTESGLTNRRKFAENLKVQPGQIKLFLSLHNNAAGMGDQWMSARGFEIWTKKGIDLADTVADMTFPVMQQWFPAMKMRTYSDKPGFKDKEGELSVLKAEGVYSLLFEYLFQDNKEDVELLLNEEQNKRFEDAVVDLVEMVEKYLNK